MDHHRNNRVALSPWKTERKGSPERGRDSPKLLANAEIRPSQAGEAKTGQWGEKPGLDSVSHSLTPLSPPHPTAAHPQWL